MSNIGNIDVTEVDLRELVRAAYSPSRQQGLGLFDSKGASGELPEATVDAIVERGKADRMCAVSMDYVNGRSVKFHVRKVDGRLFIHNGWYDHSDDELGSLLERVGLDRDLIGKARAERVAYDDRCKAAALEFLKAKGGSYEQNRGEFDPNTPEDIDAGLWVAKIEGLVTEEYLPKMISRWSLSTLST